MHAAWGVGRADQSSSGFAACVGWHYNIHVNVMSGHVAGRNVLDSVPTCWPKNYALIAQMLAPARCPNADRSRVGAQLAHMETADGFIHSSHADLRCRKFLLQGKPQSGEANAA